MRKIIFIILLIFSNECFASSILDNLKNTKKTSYLDFILLKIENRLIQRHGLLGAQYVAMRIQYQSIGSQVDYFEKESKIVISVLGVMDKERYKQKYYKPKISDCNILRNILLYGKYGYNVIFQKRNKHLTNEDMYEIFIDRFLNNLTLSDEEKDHLVKNIFAEVQIIDAVKGNDFSCKGNIAEDLN